MNEEFTDLEEAGRPSIEDLIDSPPMADPVARDDRRPHARHCAASFTDENLCCLSGRPRRQPQS